MKRLLILAALSLSAVALFFGALQLAGAPQQPFWRQVAQCLLGIAATGVFLVARCKVSEWYHV
jgi:hypothetical protein